MDIFRGRILLEAFLIDKATNLKFIKVTKFSKIRQVS